MGLLFDVPRYPYGGGEGIRTPVLYNFCRVLNEDSCIYKDCIRGVKH